MLCLTAQTQKFAFISPVDNFKTIGLHVSECVRDMKQGEVCRTGKPVWGFCNKTDINNLEKLHVGAGRIEYGLPWDTANWMGRFGNNVQNAINGVCLRMYKKLHRHGI